MDGGLELQVWGFVFYLNTALRACVTPGCRIDMKREDVVAAVERRCPSHFATETLF
jgi:hypothetical protein